MNIFSTFSTVWAQSRVVAAVLCGLGLALGTGLSGTTAFAADVAAATHGGGPRFCTRTAILAKDACAFELVDDFKIAFANCINISDKDDREECIEEVRDDRAEAKMECRQQFRARRRVCAAIGEARYDPDIDPTYFVDPNEIGNSIPANPYFPLVVGHQRILENEDEVITVTVTDKTKLIDGVMCRVVEDIVSEDGVPIEITADWYAQDMYGNVWYFGEDARDFETFEGDDPEEPELVSIDGSWKSGRDGSKPGIIAHAHPQVGETYREEISLGEAEDMAEVLSITGNEMTPGASCNGACLVTRNFTALEPGVDEIKYHAPGIGVILEIDDEGNRTELVEFNQL